MTASTVLIVATRPAQRDLLATSLRSPAWRLLYAATADEAAAILRAVPVTIAVVNGLEDGAWRMLAQSTWFASPRVAFVRVIDAKASAGAPAPTASSDPNGMVATTAQVRALVELVHQAPPGVRRVAFRRSGERRHRSRRFIGVSPRVRQLLDHVAGVPERANVLLVGESGTGKELVARMLVGGRPTEPAPFITVGCGALSERWGARTLFGAPGDPDALGALARATGGTLLLDDVGDLHPVLQEAIAPLVPAVPVRFIATTSTPLTPLVLAGRFRGDLMAMLSRVVIHLPSLRERPEDLVPLAEYFAARQATEMGRRTPRFTPAALARLAQHDWPGNVRELQHTIDRAVVHCEGELIDERHLALAALRGSAVCETADPTAPLQLPDLDIRRAERLLLVAALERAHGDQAVAAGMLGIQPRTLRRKMLDLRAQEASAAGAAAVPTPIGAGRE